MLTTPEPAEPKPVRLVPELVGVQELYGDAISVNLRSARTVITIPWEFVAGVSADKITNERYTFIRRDTGEDIATFRPRQIAETIRIDLRGMGLLSFPNNKTFDFGGTKQIWMEYAQKT
jgi:hypothetical protein